MSINYRNKLRRNFYALIFLFLSYLPSYSKDYFREGYIVNNNSDTIKGYVLYLDWNTSITTIQFKKAKEAGIENLQASEIKGFYVEYCKRFYKSHHITYKMYKDEVIEGESYVSKVVQGDFFMQTCISGASVGLYKFYDEKKDIRFFLEKKNELTELNYHKYHLLLRNGEKRQIDQSGYRNQLKYLLRECKMLEFNDVFYWETTLRNKVDFYIKCATSFREDGRD